MTIATTTTTGHACTLNTNPFKSSRMQSGPRMHRQPLGAGSLDPIREGFKPFKGLKSFEGRGTCSRWPRMPSLENSPASPAARSLWRPRSSCCPSPKRFCRYLNALPTPPPSAPWPGKRKWDDPKGGEKGDKGRGRGKGKSSKGEGRKEFTVPEGCVSRVNDKPVCFAFNQGRCRFRVNSKNRCGRGFHICWRAGCGSDRPGHLCTKGS